MSIQLNEEQKRVANLGKELAKDFATRAAEHDRDRSAPEENYKKLQEAGLFGVAIPKEYGGLGVGFLGYTAFVIELAQGCASTANSFNMHANATGSILQHPDIPENVKRKVAKLAIEKGKLMCTSVSEPDSSSLLASAYTPSLEARKVEGGYTLHGKKHFVQWSNLVIMFTYMLILKEMKISRQVLVF